MMYCTIATFWSMWASVAKALDSYPAVRVTLYRSRSGFLGHQATIFTTSISATGILCRTHPRIPSIAKYCEKRMYFRTAVKNPLTVNFYRFPL